MLRFFNRLLGRHQNTLPPFDFARNKYPAKKKWPPYLRALTEKQQFRFERKFKRRIKMKSIRPVWNKWTKIVQWSLITFIAVYGVLFHDFRYDPMNPTPGEQPFKGLRKKMIAGRYSPGGALGGAGNNKNSRHTPGSFPPITA
ncbi:hypothetical protein ACET3X_008906 [Alternaria dauci]|uniref:Uncharacterized protein n=1 Tax=Alternaria dauci TaxID=48095 RepID=A0ABR3U802_9PLEO